ncbi:hypothetical protein PHBOTO_001847 [Pseudozyma hubeiensis]|nr:hypothetical protein PHBOTO_001847 [Pseudozyma hubeiensis]
MASPLRRSARGARNADPTATTPEPSAISPSSSPSKADRKRKRADDPVVPSNDLNGANGQVADSAADSSSESIDRGAAADSTQANGDDADAPTTDPGSQKPQLSKKIQSLLGLPGSSTASSQASHSAQAGLETASAKVQELLLSQHDAHKLSTILATLNSADLIALAPPTSAKGKLRSANGTSDPGPTLQDLLRPGASLRELSAHLQSLREPLLAKPDITRHLNAGHSAASDAQVAKDLARLSTLTLVLGLVDQLASNRRQADTSTEALKGQLLCASVEERARSLEANNARKHSKDDAIAVEQPSSSNVGRPEDVDSSANRYALHMRLPRGDYFTKAITLDPAQLKRLDPAQADLVQISAQSEEQMRALKRPGLVPTPTLGQRLGRSGPRHRIDSKRAAHHHSRIQPVTFLNYGNYSSFAPTYDSSASSISYATSSNLWRDKIRSQHSISLAWGERPFVSYEDEEYEEDDLDSNAPVALSGNVDIDGDISMDAAQGDPLAEALQSLLQDVDQDRVGKSLAKLDQDELVTEHLRFNMMLLHRLQEFQWARLRRAYRPSGSSRSSSLVVEDEAPSAEEEATASLLLESLSSLVALRPCAVDLSSNVVDGVVPDAAKLRAFSASSGAIDPDLLGDVRDGFWGALDANVVKVTKTGGVHTETPLVLRDDTTIRLTDESGSKVKKPARRNGASNVEDRGRGALERFAGSRTYDHKQDRHDMEAARTEAATGASGEQRTSMPRAELSSPAARPAAMSPNARMHSGYGQGPGPAMSPHAQRGVPGPNASYAFASPSGGLSYQSRPMPPNPQGSFAHPVANWAGQAQSARQS